MRELLSVKEAQKKVLSARFSPRLSKLTILDSLGLVLAEDITSKDNIPNYDNSAMDGYAVKAADIKGAARSSPVRLRIYKGDIAAGDTSKTELEPGFCIPIMTGAAVPRGCDCVVMKEDTEAEGSNLLVYRECSKGENIRLGGEDIRKGELVLSKLKKLYPADIGILASLGIGEVTVYAPPRVGIISTGNEIIEIDKKLSPGKVRDSNSYSLASQVREAGAKPVRYGIVPDHRDSLQKNISGALKDCDLLLLSGGVSVGEYDYVKEILVDAGAELIFWRVNQKPGKPLTFLTSGDKMIFGLPGNPVSVMVCFEMYVRPLIRKMMGYEGLFRKKVRAKALEDIRHKKGRTNFARVILSRKGGTYYFKPTGAQGSGILTSMSKADGIAVFGQSLGGIKKGDKADVYLLKRDA